MPVSKPTTKLVLSLHQYEKSFAILKHISPITAPEIIVAENTSLINAHVCDFLFNAILSEPEMIFDETNFGTEKIKTATSTISTSKHISRKIKTY